MVRRLAAWLVAFPLMAAGTYLSHCYALALVDPSSHAAAHHAGHTGGMPAAEFFLSAPFALACLALVAVAFAFRATLSFRGHGAARMAAWPFAVVPALGFVLHQVFAGLAATGSVSARTFVAPAFLLGLVLQVPFGLVVYRIVRSLLRLAQGLGVILAGLRRSRRASTPPRRPRRSHQTHRPRLALLSLSAAPRAPPPAFLTS